MPFKSCPNGHFSGVRTLVCRECNHSFKSGEKSERQIQATTPPTSAVVKPPAIRIEAPKDFKAPPQIFIGRHGRINLDTANHFKGLIDRENHLDLVMRALQTADDTDFEVTPHVLISGPTGSGKSTLMRGLKSMIGKDNYLDISAPNSTQAGIVNDLMDRNPRAIKVVFINELDKTKGSGDNFKWVLSAMDEERQIKICNANNSTTIPMYAIFIADCNDLQKVETMQVNAIASRFTTRIHCDRLSNESLWKAVKQSVDKIPGANDAWIQPAIDFVAIEEGQDNVRRMIHLACMGRDGWLDGSYANTLRSIRAKS